MDGFEEARRKIEEYNRRRPHYICVVGPTGPTGPTGPAGTSSENIVAFFTSALATNVDPVLTETAETPAGQTDIVLDAITNQVLLSAGDYLIRFGTTAESQGSDLASISLTVNGIIVPITTRTGNANENTVLTGEYLISAADATAIGLSTTLNEDTTYTNTYLTIQQMNA